MMSEVEGKAVGIRASDGLRAGYGAVEARQTPEDFQAIRDQIEGEISRDVLSETP